MAVAEKHRQTDRDVEVRKKVKASPFALSGFRHTHKEKKAETEKNLKVITCMRHMTDPSLSL